MIQNDYEYDLINHPYLSEFFDQDSGMISQSFTIPPDTRTIHGFRIKISKYGSPGPIHYSIGSKSGGNDVAEGMISPGRVFPVYELLIGDDFDPQPVIEGKVYYLNLRVASGKRPFDAYRIYGPNTLQDTGGDENIKLPYWWYQRGDWLDDLDIPLPQKYAGPNLPAYSGGSRYLADGSESWDLSFIILTEDDIYPEDGEQRFEFVKPLLDDPYSEWERPEYTLSSLRNACKEPTSDSQTSVTINRDWGVQELEHPSPICRNAVLDLRTFLKKTANVELENKIKSKNFKFTIADTEDLLPGEESFTIKVDSDHVSIQAHSPKGILRAVHWLEDQMLMRNRPVIEPGVYQIAYRYPLRMVSGIHPSPGYFQLQDATVWTPGYLWRISRSGYNAIFVSVNVEEIVENSAIIPEMNDPNASVAIERLRRVTEMAGEYGIDIYVYLKTGYYKPFKSSVYQRLPQIKSYARHGDYPCSGHTITLNFYKETLQNLFRRVEKLKGLIICYDTEGFYSCLIHNKTHRCPYCKNFPIEDLSRKLFLAMLEGIHSANPEGELILWTYFCDEPWNYDVIENMPSEAALMACYSQFAEIDRFGIKILTDDYSLCSAKPGEYFLKVQRMANQKGLRFLCKTEDAYGQEFVSTPYTPCLELHQQRWDMLNQQHVDGFFSQYVHIGFMPGPCSDLMRVNVLKVVKDGCEVTVSEEEKLRVVAALNYGTEAVDQVVEAWKCFSRAIREYFPHTMGVSRYPGPLQSAVAQPFNLDPAEEIPRRWSRGYVGDLRWTAIRDEFLVDRTQNWDEDVVLNCFQKFMEYYEEGNDYLLKALSKCEDRYKDVVNKAINVSYAQYLLVRSLANFIRFMKLRETYLNKQTRKNVKALISVCESEKDNALEALRLCENDSRIGYSSEGAGTVRGGLFTPKAIRQKLVGLDRTLKELHGNDVLDL